MQPNSQSPTPSAVFKALNAYQDTAALRAAIELDLFTAVGAGYHTASTLARRCDASERGVRSLCDYLTVNGFLTKKDSIYGLTPVSAAFLDRHSPKCLASVSQFLCSSYVTDRFKDLTAVVRKGGTVLDGDGGLTADHPMWVTFARSIAPMMALPAKLIATQLQADAAPPWKVLDIAAGHGLFGIALATHNPNAEVVAVDWPNVLEVAKANAQAASISSRYRTLPGSAFEVDFGTGYDLVLLTNFIHHFDPPTCEKLLHRVRAALAPGGRAVTLAFVPNEDRVSPPAAATFSLNMLAGTEGGDAYTFSQYQEMFRHTGFARTELRELPPTEERLIIAHI